MGQKVKNTIFFLHVSLNNMLLQRKTTDNCVLWVSASMLVRSKHIVVSYYFSSAHHGVYTQCKENHYFYFGGLGQA